MTRIKPIYTDTLCQSASSVKSACH